MNLKMNSKNYVLKGYMKEEIEKSLSKLEKFFTDDTLVNVTVSGLKNAYKADITVSINNQVLKSEIEDKNLNTAIDKAVSKIERQLEKYKTKLLKHNNDSIRYENIKEYDSPTDGVFDIVKNKQFKLNQLSPEEACFQLELLDHSFYVFENKDTESIAVVYKRSDGNYGLIEVES